MKGFLLRVFQFIVFLFILFTVAIMFIDSRAKVEANNYKLSSNIKVICIGDSHMRTAINPKHVKNLFNAAIHGESFIYSYYKIKQLTRSNKQINTILLGVGCHNLSNYYDENSVNESSIAHYLPLLSFDDQRKALYRCSSPVSYALTSYSTYAKKLVYDQDPFWLGKFENISSDSTLNKSQLEKRIAEQYYNADLEREIAVQNTEYLKKIIEYCEGMKIKLVLVNTPVHDAYRNLIPQKFKHAHKDLILDFDLEIIDFSDIHFSDKHFLPDGDHLNEIGSKIASKYIDSLIQLENYY